MTVTKKIYKTAVFGLLINIAYSVYNIVVGTATHSWWLLTLGVYYAVLSFTRFLVIRTKHIDGKPLVQTTVGILIMSMSLPLAGTVILASVKDRGIAFGKIIMITIALYTFMKVTLAVVKLAKSRQGKAARERVLRNIAVADALASVFSLQRSMLVSFEGMTPRDIRTMNIITGSAVCIAVFALGLRLVLSRQTAFAKKPCGKQWEA